MDASHAQRVVTEIAGLENSGSLVDEIANTIAAEICGSHYQPGQRILHQELTARFNASFGPIREALLKLERERLVEILPRRGARVVRLTVDEVENLMAIRCAIYPVLARAAVSRGTDEELAAFQQEVDALIEVMRSEAPVEEVMLQAYRAGGRLALAGRNDWATSIVRSTVRQPNWAHSHRGLETRQERTQAARVWEAFGEAVCRRDSEAAAAAAQNMVLRSINAVLPKLYAEMDTGDRSARDRLKAFPTPKKPSRSKGKQRRSRS
jgi:DNA-binding GntR family transcriptional regulator